MKNLKLLIFALLLSSCSVVSNIKGGLICTFDESQCKEVPSQEQIYRKQQQQHLQTLRQERDNKQNEYLTKAEIFNQKKCNIFYKKGTANYANCCDSKMRLFKSLASLYHHNNYETAFKDMVNKEIENEKICKKYGIKNTSELVKCKIKLENKNLQQIYNGLQNSSSYMPYNVNCSSYTIDGTTHTNCY